MSSKKIDFEDWGAIDIVQARALASLPDVKPLWLRVWFAAIGWSNLIGHAEFAPGGLSRVLASFDPQTGEESRPSYRHVCNAVADAKKRGLIERDSSPACLRPNVELWQKRAGLPEHKNTSRTCKHHRIRSRAAGGTNHAQSVTESVTTAVTDSVTKCHEIGDRFTLKLADSSMYLPPAGADPNDEQEAG